MVTLLLNPVVLVEVLSDSTEAYDRGKKFEHYRTIPRLAALHSHLARSAFDRLFFAIDRRPLGIEQLSVAGWPD